ncbi:MAG TPA: hypothetical protein VKM72_00395 [Thermoanaerobaculia bacterium]|nr:hypothetical protein [Thermoanaerobaculia bacterium]
MDWSQKKVLVTGGLGPQHEIGCRQPGRQPLLVLLRQRSVVMDSQPERLGGMGQQASQAKQRHLHVGMAEQRRDGLGPPSPGRRGGDGRGG